LIERHLKLSIPNDLLYPNPKFKTDFFLNVYVRISKDTQQMRLIESYLGRPFTYAVLQEWLLRNSGYWLEQNNQKPRPIGEVDHIYARKPRTGKSGLLSKPGSNIMQNAAICSGVINKKKSNYTLSATEHFTALPAIEESKQPQQLPVNAMDSDPIKRLDFNF
jgi:hypothetical protein